MSLIDLPRVASDAVEQRTLHLLEEMLGDMSDAIGVRLWNGTLWPDDLPRAATLVLQHSGALAEMFSAGTEVGVAEAFIHNDFDVEGEIESLFDFGDALLARLDNWKEKLRLAGLLFALPR